MKILLFGKDGQVGRELQRSLAPLGEVVALGSRDARWPSDFSQPERLRETVAAIAPDVIVNAAAYTAVDRAEDEPARAHAINAVAPAVLAEAAEALGAWLVHYSTDYVFDGGGQRPWREDDPPAPLNVYGRSKLEGERRVCAACRRHLVLRTSWVHSRHGGNFIRTVLRLAMERDRLRFVDDQIGAPTGADLIADVTAHALRQLLRGAAPAGLYHLAAAGETSWYGYARFIVDALRAHPLTGQAPWQAPDIEPIPSAAYPLPARRPQNSRLDTVRLRTVFDLTLPDWREGVQRTLEDLLRAAPAHLQT